MRQGIIGPRTGRVQSSGGRAGEGSGRGGALSPRLGGLGRLLLPDDRGRDRDRRIRAHEHAHDDREREPSRALPAERAYSENAANSVVPEVMIVRLKVWFTDRLMISPSRTAGARGSLRMRSIVTIIVVQRVADDRQHRGDHREVDAEGLDEETSPRRRAPSRRGSRRRRPCRSMTSRALWHRGRHAVAERAEPHPHVDEDADERQGMAAMACSREGAGDRRAEGLDAREAARSLGARRKDGLFVARGSCASGPGRQ